MSISTDTRTQTCAACTHWNSLSSAEGECRRQPPQAISFKINDEVRFETRFPKTTAQDWCGEFAAK